MQDDGFLQTYSFLKNYQHSSQFIGQKAIKGVYVKKENDTEEVFEIIIDNPYISAVFAVKNLRNLNKPFEIQPYNKTPGQVGWRIVGRGILQVLEEIYADTPVPINSYIKMLKEIRSQIFLFKQVGGSK